MGLFYYELNNKIFCLSVLSLWPFQTLRNHYHYDHSKHSEITITMTVPNTEIRVIASITQEVAEGSYPLFMKTPPIFVTLFFFFKCCPTPHHLTQPLFVLYQTHKCTQFTQETIYWQTHKYLSYQWKFWWLKVIKILASYENFN